MEKTQTLDLNCVFYGTPDFAAHQLEYLVKNGVKIVAVVTTPDRKQGRGKKLKACAVKEMAITLDLPVLEPQNLKAPEFLEALKAYKPQLQIIVAFRMLPEVVWNLPPMGTINLHASYLPSYRGAAPINWALINGEEETGVSTFLLKHEIDTGSVLLRKKVNIDPEDNFGSLYQKLMKEGAPLLLESVVKYLSNDIKPIAQKQLNGKEVEAPKLDAETGKINWNLTATEVVNLIRGLSPAPGAYTLVEKMGQKVLKLKVYDAELSECKNPNLPGNIELNDQKQLLIHCFNSVISVKQLQLEGKRAMNAKEFCNGTDIRLYKIIR